MTSTLSLSLQVVDADGLISTKVHEYKTVRVTYVSLTDFIRRVFSDPVQRSSLRFGVEDTGDEPVTYVASFPSDLCRVANVRLPNLINRPLFANTCAIHAFWTSDTAATSTLWAILSGVRLAQAFFELKASATGNGFSASMTLMFSLLLSSIVLDGLLGVGRIDRHPTSLMFNLGRTMSALPTLPSLLMSPSLCFATTL